MAFSLDDFLDKAAEAFDKSAEDHYRKSEQAEEVSELLTDPNVRDQIDSLIVNGSILIATVAERVKGIFKSEDDGPTEDPEPEEEDEPSTKIPGLPEDFQERLRTIINNINTINQRQSHTGDDRFSF